MTSLYDFASLPRRRTLFPVSVALLQVCLLSNSGLPAQEARREDFVDLSKTIPGLIVDSPYAGVKNFLKRRMYPANTCYLRRAVAERLAKVQADLQKQGCGLKVLDAYRPLDVQKAMWKIVPDPRYVADPAKGSRHNRGAAVDVTLVNAKGEELEMPTKFDDFTKRAHVDAEAGKEATKNRALLQTTMNRHGFVSLATEWWHFDAPDWQSYPIEEVTFDQLKQKTLTPGK